MMNREQGQAIAALMAALREEWDQPGCLAALADVKDRDAHDVALAAVRLAATPAVRTPGALRVDGPHWRERVVPKRTPTDELCRTCNHTEANCRRLYATDHTFVSVAEFRRQGYGHLVDGGYAPDDLRNPSRLPQR